MGQNDSYKLVALSHKVKEVKNGALEQREFWDFKSQSTIDAIFAKWKPEMFFNFAALTSGTGMFDQPRKMVEINALAVVKMLEAIRRFSPNTSFLQAGSSEMFGYCPEFPQDENSPMLPRSPYGAAKLHAHHLVKIYRYKYDIAASNLILYNHESVHRPDKFVTKKIARAAVKISLGRQKYLDLFSLESKRDWSHAKDVIDAFLLVGHASQPDDYIVASGSHSSVADLCSHAFEHLGLDYRKYVRTKGDSGQPEVALLGDSKKLKSLGWESTIGIKEIMTELVNHELRRGSE